jgi:hypothetical protein
VGDSSPHLSKGNPVNIPEPGYGYYHGNVNELGNASGSPGKSYLFFLTVGRPEIRLTGDRAERLVEHRSSAVSGALSMARENPREGMIFVPGRTHNRSRSPR